MKTIFKTTCLTLLLLISSCKETNQSITKQLDNKNQEEQEITSDNSQKSTEKLNLLINSFNSFSSSCYKSYDSYVKSFGDDTENFTRNRSWYNGANISDNTTKEITELKKATEIKIYSELDPLILDYQDKAKKLTAILNSSYSYFDMKDYDSDNFEKAKDNHKQTLDAYNVFFEADSKLRQKSDSIQNKLEIAHLKKLKEKGETLNYLVGMSINVSSKMLNVAQSADYANLNVEDLEKSQKEVRLIFDELTQFKNDKPDQFNADHNMSSYYRGFKDFTKSANELYKRKKENKPFSTGEKMNLNPSAGWMVNGSTYQVLRKYNDLVAVYNRMIN